MNLLTKTTPWVASLMILSASTFADDKTCRPQRKSFEQAQKAAKAQMLPGYNAPARIDVRGSWDVFASASFIYWQLSQDNMEVAFADGLSNDAYTTSTQVKGNVVSMDFDYKPGFKVGLGVNFDHDDWNSFAEYTRIHTTNSSSTNGTLVDGVPAPLLPMAGHPYVQPSNVYNTAKETWRSDLDFIDIDLGRAYYVGSQLTFRPFFGARSAFITQSAHYHYVNTGFTNAGAVFEIPGVMDVYKRLHSWSIGPRAGVNTNWAVGQGIRFFGNANADILYTKYKIQDKTTFIATAPVGGITAGTNQFFISKERSINLRTHLDLELGLGWGSYFDNNNWHIDLSAAYGFQAFFDQNMFATFINDVMTGRVIEPNGNLYAQGLTTTVRFDF